MNMRCRPRYKRLCERIAERFTVILERKKRPIDILISSSEISYLRVRYLKNNTVHAAAEDMQSAAHNIPRVRISEAAVRVMQIIDIIQIKVLFFIFDILSENFAGMSFLHLIYTTMIFLCKMTKTSTCY